MGHQERLIARDARIFLGGRLRSCVTAYMSARVPVSNEHNACSATRGPLWKRKWAKAFKVNMTSPSWQGQDSENIQIAQIQPMKEPRLTPESKERFDTLLWAEQPTLPRFPHLPLNWVWRTPAQLSQPRCGSMLAAQFMRPRQLSQNVVLRFLSLRPGSDLPLFGPRKPALLRSLLDHPKEAAANRKAKRSNTSSPSRNRSLCSGIHRILSAWSCPRRAAAKTNSTRPCMWLSPAKA